MTQPDPKTTEFTPDDNKLEALGRLSSRVSHDLNNILGAIEGYSTLVLNTLKEGDPIKPDLEEIRRAVAKAAALTKSLLMFSRRQALHKEPCDLNAAAVKLSGTMAAAPGGSVLELDLQPDLPALLADPSLPDQLLAILTLNARDAMPDGGPIRVTTRAVTLAPNEVRSRNPAEAGPQFIRLSVRDAGRGITKDAIGRIFEPFFTTKPKGQGAGLGLAMVYGAVTRNNGWLTVRTEEGKGTEFLVYLPAAAASPSPTP
ncbi:MAG TPA: hypothetical protein DCS63_07070 [Elusimicrobia bacterium]|nr:hypothetical protein [Elusimicrobiota bacterium]